MAGTAQRYSAIASGQIASGQASPGAYLPPMAGVGAAGSAGAARRGRTGPRAAESSNVWGATGGAAGHPDRRCRSSRPSAEVEDDSVWSAGASAPRSLDAS